MTSTRWYETEPTYLDVGHSRIPHWQVGAGPDLLFIHGWPLHAATFRDLVPLLAQRFTCHVIDLPGCGRSHWSRSSQISLRAHAASMRAVADQLGLSRYGVVAHDSGAVIGRLLSADDARVSALVMGNTEIPGHRPKQVELLVWLTKLRLGKLFSLPVLGIPALRRSALGYKGCFHDVMHLDGEFGRLFIQPLLRSPKIAAGQERLLHGFDWSLIDSLGEVHARIRSESLLIWGADDPYFPIDKARRMLDQFRGGAALHAISPGKLFVNEEFPQRFAAAALPFLERKLAREPREAASSTRGAAE
ncbi:MAG TPA: alpha/beta hydrolase [Polyangiales bacterium]